MNPWQVLDNPVVWEVSRIGLNLSFGLYRKRMQRMRDWGVLQANPSVLDIGCGIGQYANVTEGDYLGVDFNQRYIDYAHSKRRRTNRGRCPKFLANAAEGSRWLFGSAL